MPKARKKLIWDISYRIHPKETVMKFLLQLSFNFSEKATHHNFLQCLLQDFPEYCSVLGHWKNIMNAFKEQKYSPEDVLEKS